MNLSPFFKSIIDQDEAAVVICDLEHTMLYLNPAAQRSYEKYGGAALTGRSLLSCHNEQSNMWIQRIVQWFAEDPSNNRVHTFFNGKQNKDVYMVALRDENGALIGYYEKHEYRTKDDTPLYQLP